MRKFVEYLDGRTDAPVHFLGAMVLDQKQTPTTHVERRQVIDGQSRCFQIPDATADVIADANVLCQFLINAKRSKADLLRHGMYDSTQIRRRPTIAMVSPMGQKCNAGSLARGRFSSTWVKSTMNFMRYTLNLLSV